MYIVAKIQLLQKYAYCKVFFLDNVPIPPTKATTMFKIDFSALYPVICKYVCKDTTTLLLYLLLHRNHLFKTYVMNRTDIEYLVSIFLIKNNNNKNVITCR